ncbi:hypothetical protein [Salimicrobium halophilum]|uniref:Uncharacterized protein n=1 Tax=Salimicrobium halophilum TaxID=86666 RepID=A0A1G8R7W7_9BACI|nr:hypothetical protein [Salimicrobium halophilum]SDJ13124.1 hypothetical protein SAMN04490247_0885 [Salimicrobium halophilum]
MKKIITGSLLLGIGLSMSLSYFMTNRIDEEEKKLLGSWAYNMQVEYSDWSYALTNALASGTPDKTLSYLEEVESAEGHSWIDGSILEIADIPPGQEGYAYQDRFTYGYIRYLTNTWEDDGLSKQEREVVTAIRDYANVSSEAYREIRKMTSPQEEGDFAIKIGERLKELREEVDPYQEVVHKDEKFREYQQGDSQKVGTLFQGEPALEHEELKERAKQQVESVLDKEMTLDGSGVGTGHLYRDSGAGEVHFYTGNGERYRMAVSTHGGHLLGITMDSLDVYPVKGNLEEAALHMVEASEVPGENWTTDVREFDDEVVVSVFQTKNGVEQRDFAVKADFQKQGDGYALTWLDLSFAYKDKSQQDVSVEVTPEQARDSISSSVTVEGDSKLAQDDSSRLVYIFPISGLERYSKALVDATTGEFIRVK